MAVRTAGAEWKGDLPSGAGQIGPGSGAFESACDFRSRMESGASKALSDVATARAAEHIPRR